MSLITPEFGIIFWTLVVFGLVLFILGKYAWKPILSALDERERTITDSLAQAEKAREEMANLNANHEQLLDEAREESNKMLREAKEIRDQTINKSKGEAKVEYARIIAEAKEEIDRQKLAAIAELKNQVGSLALEISGKVLRKELATSGLQQEYISILVDEAKMN